VSYGQLSGDVVLVGESAALSALCSVCGLALGDPAWFLATYEEAGERVMLDGPIHEPCALAATRLCPHLARGD
jgi:hypothetical protein